MAAMSAAAVFRTSGWKWSRSFGGEDGFVPDVDQIEETLLSLVDGLEVGHTRGTGRLYVEHDEEGDLRISISLGRLEGFFAAEEVDRAAA